MKLFVLFFALFSSLASAQTPVAVEVAAAPLAATVQPYTACEGVRVVEFRNSVLAAHLACERDLSNEDYNAFIIANRAEISAANDAAVSFFMTRDHSRRKFDRLDSVVMNAVSLRAVADKGFCDQVWYFKLNLAKQSFAEALAGQTLFVLPACGQY